jgi:hypothetical protein
MRTVERTAGCWRITASKLCSPNDAWRSETVDAPRWRRCKRSANVEPDAYKDPRSKLAQSKSCTGDSRL